jgi:hypothetical protein
MSCACAVLSKNAALDSHTVGWVLSQRTQKRLEAISNHHGNHMMGELGTHALVKALASSNYATEMELKRIPFQPTSTQANNMQVCTLRPPTANQTDHTTVRVVQNLKLDTH